MDIKNTTILLMFLLCILGLAVGACITDEAGNLKSPDDIGEVINPDLNNTSAIDVELKNNTTNFNNTSTLY